MARPVCVALALCLVFGGVTATIAIAQDAGNQSAKKAEYDALFQRYEKLESQTRSDDVKLAKKARADLDKLHTQLKAWAKKYGVKLMTEKKSHTLSEKEVKSILGEATVRSLSKDQKKKILDTLCPLKKTVDGIEFNCFYTVREVKEEKGRITTRCQGNCLAVVP